MLSRLTLTPAGGDCLVKKKRSSLTRKVEDEIQILQRHILMLKTVRRHEPIGIIRLGELLSLPDHKVRYSLRILEQEGIIEPSTEGAVTTPKVNEFLQDLTKTLDNFRAAVEGLRESIR
ncbi:MAG: hypothetical protein AB1665_02500 [Candidatus Thermoplasmatota archaeon]